MRTDVAFKLQGSEQPLVFVPVHVNRQGPYSFVLDTGASLCMLSAELAARLRIEPTETKPGVGAAGKIRVSLGRADSVAIGDARVDGLQVGITDAIRNICSALAATDGIIGYNYLKEFRLTLDYQATTLRLERGGREPVAEVGGGFHEIGFRLAHRSKPLILLSVTVNGQGPYAFVLDSGASSTVISTGLADELGVERKVASPVRGAGGPVPASTALLDSIALGSARCQDLPVVVADFLAPLSQLIDSRLDGIVGYSFLRQYRVTIDYPKGVVRFRAASTSGGEPIADQPRSYRATAGEHWK